MKPKLITHRNIETCKVFEVRTQELTFKSINNKYLKSISIYWGGIHAESKKQEVNTGDELINFAQRFLEENNAK